MKLKVFPTHVQQRPAMGMVPQNTFAVQVA